MHLKSLIAKETSSRMCIRLLALSHIKGGANGTQAATYIEVSRNTISIGLKGSMKIFVEVPK
jgi:hypothetical protein